MREKKKDVFESESGYRRATQKDNGSVCHYIFSFCTSLRHYLYYIDTFLHDIAPFCIKALIFSAK